MLNKPNHDAEVPKVSKKRNTKKIVLISLGIVFIPIALIALLIGWQIYKEAKAEHWFEYQAMIKAGVLSEELVTKGQLLGLKNISKFPVYRIEQAKMYGLETRDGGTMITGCYDGSPICEVTGIFIRNGLEGEDLDAVLAHEYLHAMYTVDNLGTNKALEQGVRSTFANTPQLSTVSLADYPEEKRTIEEVFVYACTDANDKWLSEDVLAKCNHYIDRTKIKLLY